MKIIINPPYNNNLHLKILRKATQYSNEIVNLSPTRWLLDPLAEYKKHSDWYRFEDVRKKIYSLDTFTKKEIDEYFGIASEMTGIYCLDDKGGYKPNHDFGKHIIERTEKFYIDYVGHKKTSYWLPVAKYRYTLSNNDYIMPFSLALSEKGTFAKTNWTKGLHDAYEIFYFDTKEELENFKSFLQLGSYKWILGHLFICKRLSAKLIPMMPTYKHKWTDKMIYEYFNLTEKEIEEASNYIKGE